MKYGVSYYPEHKTEEELQHDLKLLKESGINTVRMGEFAWCRMESSDGVYDFEWLKDVVRELGESEINTVLCTPTACPPAWLIEKYPDILYMDNRRIRRPFGGRRHYCYNNEDYRRYSVKIAAAIGRAFAGNPNISGVQIDNEPAQEGTGRCCCPVCEEKFQKWLEKKFKTIEAFNKESGSIFWSQEYGSFSQIKIPVTTIEPGAVNTINVHFENPTIRLMFERFSSESQKEYQDLQAKVLKKHLSVPVTTNGTGLATNSIDYYESTQNLDCYAFDYYPGLRDAWVDSFPYAFARGVKPGVPFWVLEFMSGGGHRFGGSGRVQPNPGALKQAVVHSMAHGGEMMLHFQFRTFPFGAEQLNYAIVDMDGIPRRRYREMQETASLLKNLEKLEKTKFPSEVAVCFDYDSHFALRIKPVNDPKFHYVDYCGRIYGLLEKAGINADVVSLKSDFSSYKAVIIPAGFVISPEEQEKIKAYVENGGLVIGTFLTSVKNSNNVGYTKSLPAGLTEVFGCTVEEIEPVFDRNKTEVKLKLGNKEHVFKDDIWSELLGGSSKPVGVYNEDYKEGEKVVSQHSYGKGNAYYIGTDLPDTAYIDLFLEIGASLGLKMNSVKRSDGVEVIGRYDNENEYMFLFNFTAEDTAVTLMQGYHDYLTGELIKNDYSIPRNGVLVAARKIGGQ